jgi:hypothetical protein
LPSILILGRKRKFSKSASDSGAFIILALNIAGENRAKIKFFADPKYANKYSTRFFKSRRRLKDTWFKLPLMSQSS